jgi:hypothetical protein
LFDLAFLAAAKVITPREVVVGQKEQT